MNTKQILRNMASNYGRMVIQIITTLLLTPFLLHRLGQEQFGLWSLTLAISSYFGIADSIATGAVRYISHYRALEDWDGLNRTIGAAMRIYIGLTVVALVVCGVVAFAAPHFFKVSPESLPLLRLMVINIGLICLIGFLSVLPIQCVIAAQRQDQLNTQMGLLQIAIALISAIGVSLGANVLLLSVLQLFSAAFNGVISYRLAKRYLPQAKFSLQWDADHGKKLGTFAGIAVFISLGSRVIYYTDTVVIGAILSIATVAAYSVILKIVELLRSLVNAGASVVGAFASEQQALGNHENITQMWYEGTKWSLAITIPVGVFLILMRQEIISTWIGSQYLWVAPALVWLVVGHIFDLSQSATWVMLLNMGKHASLALTVTLEAVLNLSLSIWLCHKIGVTGVAIGTTIPLILRCLLFYPYYMTRMTSTTLADYFRNAVAPPLYSALPTCAVFAILYALGVHGTVLSLVVMIGATLLCVPICAYTFCLSPLQKVGVRRGIGRLQGRMARSKAA